MTLPEQIIALLHRPPLFINVTPRYLNKERTSGRIFGSIKLWVGRKRRPKQSMKVTTLFFTYDSFNQNVIRADNIRARILDISIGDEATARSSAKAMTQTLRREKTK